MHEQHKPAQIPKIVRRMHMYGRRELDPPPSPPVCRRAPSRRRFVLAGADLEVELPRKLGHRAHLGLEGVEEVRFPGRRGLHFLGGGEDRAGEGLRRLDVVYGS